MVKLLNVQWLVQNMELLKAGPTKNWNPIIMMSQMTGGLLLKSVFVIMKIICLAIAGWQKKRLPELPNGIIQTTPDWVCEIVSLGHESKDTIRNFNLLCKYQVPYYWLIWPEDRVLIAYKLVSGKYLVIESLEGGGIVRIEPFENIAFDLDYIFGR
jgi:hypothetical protein